MKTKTKGMIASLLAIPAALLGGGNVFAANSYNINYTGGSDLGASGTVSINPNLVDNLNSIVKASDNSTQVTFSGSGWQIGYQKLAENGACREVRYYKAGASGTVNNLSFTIKNNKFAIDTIVKKIELDGLTPTESQFVPLIVDKTSKYIFVRSDSANAGLYSDASCSSHVSGVIAPTRENGHKAFVEMNIKLREVDKTTTYSSDKLYFGLTDIDSAQSFKILNQGNGFSESTTSAKSKEDLQKNTNNGNYKNKFVAESNGNYIYSEYNNTSPYILENNGTANVYVKLSNQTQTDGLDIVFGYASDAGSTIEYYTQQYVVTYVSDEYGIISGIKSEEVNYQENPSGSEQKPNDGYEFTYWTADKDVKLEDGTEIKAGEKITSEQVKQVVVNQNLKFTAHHIATSKEDDKKGPAAPNTGASTGEFNAAPIAVSVLGITLGALFVRLLPRLTHKKIKFN